jgi:hypothetical protein
MKSNNMLNFEARCLAIVASVTDIRAYFIYGTMFLETDNVEIGKAVFEALQINNQTIGIKYSVNIQFETFYNFI